MSLFIRDEKWISQKTKSLYKCSLQIIELHAVVMSSHYILGGQMNLGCSPKDITLNFLIIWVEAACEQQTPILSSVLPLLIPLMCH